MTDDPQHIIDRSDLRKYRTELPNLYDDADLDPFEFRLLAHYKRVGTCNEGLETTARKCKMSEGSASQKRTSLAKKKWIKLTPIMTVHGPGYSVEVIDRWEENFRFYFSRKGSHSERKPSPHEGKPSPHEGKPSPHEGKPSPGEGKKEPIKKEPLKKRSPPTPLPPPQRQVATVVGVGELEKVPPTLEETIWTWKAIPNIPARSIQTHAHGPDKFIALYLYYLTQSGIKSPLRAALARLGRGEIDPGQIFEQIGELPPTSLAILLNWLAEGASDYTTTDLNGAGVLGHAFAELFKQPPSGIQSRPQQERQAEAEQQTIRSVAVHALTDLNLWRLLPTIEPVGPTLPDVVMPDRQVSDPDPVLPPNAETWQAVLDQLWLEMSHATFDAWIRETELSSIGPDRFVIGVPTTYARDWLENRMTATIARTLALLTGNNWPVKFIVKGK
jgi:hypothetical protein